MKNFLWTFVIIAVFVFSAMHFMRVYGIDVQDIFPFVK